MNLSDELKQAIEAIMEEGRRQLLQRGHNASGNLINTMEAKITQSVGELWGEHYGLAQETGVKKVITSRAYIDAIIEWLRVKGIESDISKAKGIAFNIGKAHRMVGIHSKNSTLDQSKQNWLSDAIDNTQTKVHELIDNGAKKQIEKLIDTMWDEAQRNINQLR